MSRNDEQKNKNIYFFAESPIEYALWAGLAYFIRRNFSDVRLILIEAPVENIQGYEWHNYYKNFDEVFTLTNIRYEGSLTPNGLFNLVVYGFENCRHAKKALENIEIKRGSVAFIYNGFTLYQNIFLKYMRSQQNISTVCITNTLENLSLSDYFLDYSATAFYEIYLRYWGSSSLDQYKLRNTRGIKNRQREIRHRVNPADFCFGGVYVTKGIDLKPGQIYWPFLKTSNSDRVSNEKEVIFFGQPVHWEPSIDVNRYYARLNEILKLIIVENNIDRLVYLAHPGEDEECLSKITAPKIQFSQKKSSEYVVMNTPEIMAVYSSFSTSVFSSRMLGVPGYFVYDLFDDSIFPGFVKTKLRKKWSARENPDIHLTKEAQLNHTPILIESPKYIEATTRSMLKIVAGLDAESNEKEETIQISPELRWEDRTRFSIGKIPITFVQYLLVFSKRVFLTILKFVLPRTLWTSLRSYMSSHKSNSGKQ